MLIMSFPPLLSPLILSRILFHFFFLLFFFLFSPFLFIFPFFFAISGEDGKGANSHDVKLPQPVPAQVRAETQRRA